MTNAKYTGLARDTGRSVEDLAHIQQSVSDILRTPVGSRVMRRDYGSLLSMLSDRPQNAALRLQIMAACYSAILKWEPRVSLTGITFESLCAVGSAKNDVLVLARRVDQFSLGGKLITMPMGAYYRVRNGKILEWLDTPLADMPPPPPGAVLPGGPPPGGPPPGG